MPRGHGGTEREPRANHESGVAFYAFPLLAAVGIVSYLLNLLPLGSWWCASIPTFMILARATVDEALHASWIIPDALIMCLSDISWSRALGLLGAHALASVCLSYLREGKAGETGKRIVVITGAASGIGLALCKELIQEYDDYVIALDASQQGLDQLVAWHRCTREAAPSAAPCRLTCIQCDVSERESVERAARMAAVGLRETDESSIAADMTKNLDDARLPIHAIVHLAGVFACGPLVEEATMATAERALRVNVLGCMHVTQAFYRLMRSSSRAVVANAHGRVVVVGSELAEARVCPALTAPYAMSKLALEGYAVALRQELAVCEPPIHVCLVHPGPIDTPLSTEATERAALEHVRARSAWSAGLTKLVATSAAYRRHARPAAFAAQAMGEVVHAIRPPWRTTINYTYLMRLASWTPQWVLDLVACRALRV